MAFRFNFDVGGSDDRSCYTAEALAESPATTEQEEERTNALPSKQVHPTRYHWELVRALKLGSKFSVFTVPGGTSTGPGSDQAAVRVRYVSGSDVMGVAAAGAGDIRALIDLSDSRHSDLIPGVYEGGMKVWECALDLVTYLARSGVEFAGHRVLELGCGSGLPGIVALLRGAEEVCFQDYNTEVVQCITIPSVLLSVCDDDDVINGDDPQSLASTAVHGPSDGDNPQLLASTAGHRSSSDGDDPQSTALFKDGSLENTQRQNNKGDDPQALASLMNSSSSIPQWFKNKCRFFSGGWGDLPQALLPKQFDVVLTSETIYSPSSQRLLLDALKRLVIDGNRGSRNRTGGRVYLAAKETYFGVGGSVAGFKELVEEDGSFSVSFVHTVRSSIHRHILLLRRREL